MSELAYDSKIEKYFTRGQVPVTKKDKWDYVVISYISNGEVVEQEQLLSEDVVRELDEGLSEAVEEYKDNVDKFSNDVDSLEKKCKEDGDVAPEEELLLKQIKATSGVSEGVESDLYDYDSDFNEDDDDDDEGTGVKPNEKLLFKQIIATSISQNKDIPGDRFSDEPLMHIPGEKSDTGDDHSRTGPEGNRPRDNNDATHYEGQSDTKLNVATGIEITPEIAKQLYDVDGTIPELREGIEIKIENGTIEIEIKDDSQEEPEPTPLDLDKNPGRKNPGTHTNTIKAGEKGIADLIPISDIWKTKNDGMIEAVDDQEPFLRKIFPFLKKAGIIQLTMFGFLKLMQEQDYKQIDMFQTKTIADLLRINLTPEEQKQLNDDLKDFSPKLEAKKFKRFKYNSGAIECPICKPLDGMEFAEDDPTRPITPSEGLGAGVFNTHPNCKCTQIDFEKFITLGTEPKSEPPQSRAAAASLRERKDITAEYLRPLSESLNIYKDKQAGEFDWINDDAIEEMMKYAKAHGSGKFLLGVLSGETITDHRIEGTEQHRRKWTDQELIQNIRTAKGKMIDINHLYPKVDMQSGGVYDCNWNFTTNRGEVVIWETDQDILDAIRNDIIGAISIHTGLPRTVETNCESGECFLEPRGTILGEQDNIALAYVVTDPDGFKYNGQIIPAMPPGMNFTKIYLVE